MPIHWQDKVRVDHVDWEVVPGVAVHEDGTYEIFLPAGEVMDPDDTGLGDDLRNELVVCALSPGHGPAPGRYRISGETVGGKRRLVVKPVIVEAGTEGPKLPLVLDDSPRDR